MVAQRHICYEALNLHLNKSIEQLTGCITIKLFKMFLITGIAKMYNISYMVSKCSKLHPLSLNTLTVYLCG